MIRLTILLVVIFCSPVLAAPQLSKAEAAEEIKTVTARLAAAREAEMQWEIVNESPRTEQGTVTAGNQEMKCVSIQYGDAAAGDRSLFISMHGGGGTQARVNDQQWRNQIQLYKPEEGFYVAPRAPTNAWNLWHQKHIDLLFSRLIENFVATRGVNPKKVYLLGYSAGGDGVYQLAPRMADWFAAASMMAGHPNNATADGLFNLPFRIYVGGRDSAYKRNQVAEQWGDRLKALQQEHGGFEHKVTIYPELGHWMNRRDAEAIPWMATKERDSWPAHIIWGTSSNRAPRFYWLEGQQSGVVSAKVDGRVISIQCDESQPLTLHLKDKLLNLDQPFSVVVNEVEAWQGKVQRTKTAIEDSLSKRLDPDMAATAILVLFPKK